MAASVSLTLKLVLQLVPNLLGDPKGEAYMLINFLACMTHIFGSPRGWEQGVPPL